MSASTTNTYHSENFETQGILRQKGQLTVPVGVRDLLELQEGDKVTFIVKKDKKVELVKKTSVVVQSAGVLKSLKPVLSAEKLRAEAEQAVAEEAVRRAS